MRSDFEVVYGQPWQVYPPAWHGLHARMMQDGPNSRARDREKALAKRPEHDWLGDPIPQMEIIDDVAIIPICGMLVAGATPSDKYYFGYSSYEDVHDDLDQVEGSVSEVLLDIDSPGGTVMGNIELADRIAQMVEAGIRVEAFIGRLGCSAAYKIAAGAREIHTTASAVVGSIGTMWEIVNAQKFYERWGIEFQIFASGPYKALGHPGKELTMDQAQWCKDRVMQMAEQFKDHVRSYRDVGEPAMQGQIFTGAQALEAGLVDRLVSGRKEVLASIVASRR